MAEAILTVDITKSQAGKLLLLDEGQFYDLKARWIGAAGLSKAVSAFANADGGDLYIGIRELTPKTQREWDGFVNDEAANGHIQTFEKLFPLGTDFQYEFIRAAELPGLVLHLQVNKTQGIVVASDGKPYVRRGAQSIPVDTPDAMKRLEYAKGINSFETELTNVAIDVVIESDVIKAFVEQVVPTTTPEAWLRKQVLLRDDKPTVAGVLQFFGRAASIGTEALRNQDI